LDRLVEETGLRMDLVETAGQSTTDPLTPMRSPHTSSHLLMNAISRRKSTPRVGQSGAMRVRSPPQFVVIDLSQVSNMDASAARTCFLQFSTMCSKNGMVVCAACATPRMDWVLRSHGVSYKPEEEDEVKARIQKRASELQRDPAFGCERILLFLTIHEALEFCENAFIHQFPLRRDSVPPETPEGLLAGPQPLAFSSACARILDCTDAEVMALQRLDGLRYHDEVQVGAGDRVFRRGELSTHFYVVLSGAVASDLGHQASGSSRRHDKKILTGAGFFSQKHSGSRSNLLDPEFAERGQSDRVTTVWPVCGVFGYNDFLLERPRTFGAVATQNKTRLAKMDRSQMNALSDDPALSALVHRVLLRASILDLQNCTCRDV